MIIDIVVLVILLISGIIAFLRGLIREVLTIAGVTGGLAAAYFAGPLLAPLMRTWLGVTEGEEAERLFGILPYDVVAEALAYGIIFIAVVIILSIASHFLAEGVKKMGLGAVDRTFGFIFGIIRGVLLLGLLYLPVHLFIDQETKNTYMSDSKSRVYLEKTSEALATFIPAETTDDMGDNISSISADIKDGMGAREKLEQIDLLKEHRERQAPSDAKDNQQSGGYDAQFRDKMDDLFENAAPSNTNE